MNYDLILTAEAEADLRNIYEYIAFVLLAPEAAKKQLARLEKHIYSLNTFPERFRTYENEPWHSMGLRMFPVDNYLVFYIPDKNNNTVTVMRVFCSRRDIPSQFKSDDL